jgi:cytochrome P450
MLGPVYPFAWCHQLRLQWDPLAYLLKLRRNFGTLVRVQAGSELTFLVSEPELVQELLVTRAGSLEKARGLRAARRMLGEGLLTSEGELHHHQRKLMQTFFRPDHLVDFAGLIAALAGRLSARWRHGTNVDCLREFNQLTLAIASRTLFDADFENQAALIAGMLNQGRWLFRWGYFLFPLFEMLERLPPVRCLLQRRRRQIDELVYPLIDERRIDSRANFLSRLVQAGMDNEAIRDQAVTMLLAAHETTANALAWTLHVLAHHPEWQRALQEELDHIPSAQLPRLADTMELPLLNNVLLESMRLYPPNWVIKRAAREDFLLGGRPVPKGSTCMVSQYVLHREEHWFPEPERFEPERWHNCPRSSLPKMAYIPFGVGSRRCIGEHLALMECKLILTTLLRDWWVEPAPGQRVRPDPGISLRPRPGPILGLHRRARL